MSDDRMTDDVKSKDGALPSDSDDTRILTKERVEKIVAGVLAAVKGSDRDTTVEVHGWWNSEIRVSRNRIALSSHRRDIRVQVTRTVKGIEGIASTNQLDEASLRGVTHAAERIAMFRNGLISSELAQLPEPDLPVPQMRIWSDSTFQLPAQQQTDLAVLLANASESSGMLAAGYLEIRAGELAAHRIGRFPVSAYTPYTQAQCSMTVRHPKGVGSGWAGLSSYDWSALRPKQLVEVSLDKCMRSLNPVAIEPGRYTLILEPQAVADMFEFLFGEFMPRGAQESQPSRPFFLGGDAALGIGRSKLGLKIVDERITVSHDPANPLLGVVPYPGMQPVKWIKDGVLQSLGHDRGYALAQVNQNLGDLWRLGYSIKGGSSSVSQMIEQTERGLIVTRLSKMTLLDQRSVLSTGVTRDGLWLIERGKISKAVKNMKFTESILFALNQLDSLGEAVSVFRPVDSPYSLAGITPAVVPPMKVRDFSFTSMIDAV